MAYEIQAKALLEELQAIEQQLKDIWQQLNSNLADHVTPAEEWYLDNYYLIEEHLRQLKMVMTKKFIQQLPWITNSISVKPLPRVYALMLTLVKDNQMGWDVLRLSQLVEEDQAQQPFTLRELWAIPTWLRLALLESICVCGQQLVTEKQSRLAAAQCFDAISNLSSKNEIETIFNSHDIKNITFSAELLRQIKQEFLYDQLLSLKKVLQENQLNADAVIQEEITLQTTHQSLMSQLIKGLRRLQETEWKEVVESLSRVEQILRDDPCNVYAQMDFSTRDRYRQCVEQLAEKYHQHEWRVAEAAVLLAKEAMDEYTERTKHHSHVGYYLIDNGVAALKKQLAIKPSFREKIINAVKRHRVGCYLGGNILLTGLITYCLLHCWHIFYPQLASVLLLAVPLFIFVSEIVLSIINFVATLFIKPHQLPRMDFKEGIPPSLRTAIVVPALLGSRENVDRLIEALEIRFLGNRDDYLHFILLTDFKDALHEHMPEDADLIAHAKKKIDALNHHYGRQHAEDIFFLLHRTRRWNEKEQVWMGHERKRGKLNDLNILLCGNIHTHFSVIVGRIKVLSKIKYVITLDCDTKLPPHTASQLIGTMAHPLNQPVYDQNAQRIIAGHGILQPRISETLGSKGLTHYVWLSNGDIGMDPYTRIVSNLYQDLFGEGSFIGKGIYDVEMFQKVLWQRFPDNLILSHDLLEGCYLRSGFVSDITLYESSPPAYLTDVQRRARWIRGDWQILHWLWPRVKNYEHKNVKNPLSALSKWKLFDNLRRSLVAPSLFILLAVSLTHFSTDYVFYGMLLVLLLLPSMLTFFVDLLNKSSDTSLAQHLESVFFSGSKRLFQVMLGLACLPFEAWYSLKSIVITLWRLFFSHQHLLEWVASDQVKPVAKKGISYWLKTMWPTAIAALLLIVYLLITEQGDALLAALPLLLLWVSAPGLMDWLSFPVVKQRYNLSKKQKLLLNKLAEKTWHYFTTLAGPEDNWLPPDNFQEEGGRGVSHRTSPTNIGLGLLANLCAYDFNYLTIDALLSRTQNMLTTLLSMKRYRGHFYNWYDTQTLQPLEPRYVSSVDSGNFIAYVYVLRQGLLELLTHSLSAQVVEQIKSITSQLLEFTEVDFSFLYRPDNHLFSIGYNVTNDQLDQACYDLLASEARLASFVAIAQGQIPQDNWFALGRMQGLNRRGQPFMYSWSGSMFEYLMPLLVMPSYPDTLLDQVCHAAVREQITYGKQKHVPWGISESSYYAMDAQGDYQYRAFGVPILGLRRGLAEDLVIAPYASALALMMRPASSYKNLRLLTDKGWLGQFGLYEAIDFTKRRLPPHATHKTVRSFMAHHQAMSLLAYGYVLLNKPMQRRFTAEPLFQSALLLLQERIPEPRLSYFQSMPKNHAEEKDNTNTMSMRHFTNPNMDTPQIQLLSNGRYHVVLTQAGSGYSRWKNLAVTRWRMDSTGDHHGLFIYMRDKTHEVYGSLTYQPASDASISFDTYFYAGRVECIRRDATSEIHTDIIVSPDEDMEFRHVRFKNTSDVARTIEFTTYAEVVLAPQNDDESQPDFSNLFVTTEWLEEQQAILASRRIGGAPSLWLWHMLAINKDKHYQLSFETARDNFIGRCQSRQFPRAMHIENLSNTSGAVLDPVVAIRYQVEIDPGETVAFNVFNGVADNREDCLDLMSKYKQFSNVDDLLASASVQAKVLLNQFNASETDAQLYNVLASAILYPNKNFRAEENTIKNNKRGQSNLWRYAISGDNPILLLQVEGEGDPDIARQCIQAQEYWQYHGLIVDSILINNDPSQQADLQNLVNVYASELSSKHVFLLKKRDVDESDFILFQAVARVVLISNKGTLEEQLNSHLVSIPTPAEGSFTFPVLSNATLTSNFRNGFGDFNQVGDEYHIQLIADQVTPMPWINILANPNFGSLISESGQACTWIENSHEYRLTPWSNDPIEDNHGEVFYLRDESTKQYWSPTALPSRGQGNYDVRHGFGYSVFTHDQAGIVSELTVFVALDESIKFSRLKIKNLTDQHKKLSVFAYVQWVLGDLVTKTSPYIVTNALDDATVIATNYYLGSTRVAFLHACAFNATVIHKALTGDRHEFLGRNRYLANPAALMNPHLSGQTGAGLDPCGALQWTFEMEAHQESEFVFMLGAENSLEEIHALLQRYQTLSAIEDAYKEITDFWHKTLTTIQIQTPDVALNHLANGWLIYQTITSRLWGRTAFYQCSGAFGFRDQLQDVLAFVYTKPELCREHLLLCASRQFLEGDVQHWWHPPQGRGVRTRCSDDYLWLPYVLCHYIERTGDVTILDETIPFLSGRPLKPDEQSYYELPQVSNEKASMYEHAVRAITHGLHFGQHGLPFMGSGDWNDGMNLVGVKGKGESVWVGFFLYAVLQAFIPFAKHQQDDAFASRCQKESDKLRKNIEASAWDGTWYRRAYFDNGMPLGSVVNEECKIDSIAQTWAVLSKAAPKERAMQAMQSLQEWLIKPDNKLVNLLTPPFSHFKPNPGYIQNYVPGVRENGGQYTHAATWVGIAWRELGQTENAWQVMNFLNPGHHTQTAAQLAVYKIEPYVIAGDVYSVVPHVGRGGWSWYTGSAGWMYRLVMESLLGLQLEQGNTLHLIPSLPNEWSLISIDYRFKDTVYHIRVVHDEEESITLDDQMVMNPLPLVNDQKEHHVVVRVKGASPS